ncbi:MAG TPA: dienelactone hydrolase family protein [Gammaproteobacteria bacterium]
MTQGTVIELEADDGHRLAGWLAEPEAPRAGVVILQEIFGVNAHIRALVERYAAHGYRALAPALFDRAERGVELGYDQVEAGRSIVAGLDLEKVVMDIAAATDRAQFGNGVAVVGYCWGGALAYVAAGELPVDCAVDYYGTRVLEWLQRRPHCPVLFHFGADDPTLPPAAVQRIGAANSHCPAYVYPGAGHGFNCDQRASYHAESAALAEQRTLEFIARYTG